MVLEKECRHKFCNLVNFVMFLTSIFITCFIDNFTSEMKSQSYVYLINGSAHEWVLDLENEVCSICNLWTSGLQDCKDNVFLEVSGTGSHLRSGEVNLEFVYWGCPAHIHLPPERS